MQITITIAAEADDSLAEQRYLVPAFAADKVIRVLADVGIKVDEFKVTMNNA